MFLKALSLKGFKSFAEPTELELEPGITVVVGPNGSGKSNVVDAVTWVLGAQGPRALRSQRMEDVIFAGTTSRPPLGRAEVSLTMDNSSGQLRTEMAEVTITRTLFRSGDSEYAINGAPCRLLDIQELLANSGVGRTQHMIIGQGQLDTVLNAHPEDRRAIIEEAAGVLNHRRRKERAERRLVGTQENLERLGDLVRELRRQIRPLERQASAARAHAALADELRAVRLYLAGAELEELEESRRSTDEARQRAEEEAGRLQAELGEVDEAASKVAVALSSSREEDLSHALGMVQALVERARGTGAVLRERARALTGALDAAADANVVSSLESEAARVQAGLEEVDDEQARLADELAAVHQSAERLDAATLAYNQRFGQETSAEGARGARDRARSNVELLRRSVALQQSAIETLDQRMTALAGRAAELEAAEAALGAQVAETERRSVVLGDAARLAEEQAAGASAAAAAADDVARSTAEHHHRAAARAEALARALKELEGAGGREVLEDVEGVLGSLGELVEADPGWEAAFSAAAGASVSAMVVSGREAALAALRMLHRQSASGALLAPQRDGVRPTLGGLPAGAAPMRSHVRARGVHPGVVVDDVLDALVGRAVRVEAWEDAVDLALARPDLVVVTSSGDRFADAAWRVRSSYGVLTTGAVSEAQRRAEEAAADAEHAAGELSVARAAAERARGEALAAGREVERHGAVRGGLAAERERALQERGRLHAELEEVRGSREDAASHLAGDNEELTGLEERLGELEVLVGQAAEREEAAAAARAELQRERAEVTERRQELQMREAGLAERRRVLNERGAEVERRLAGRAAERDEAAARRRRLEAEGRALGRLEALVDAEAQNLAGIFDALQAEYQTERATLRSSGERLESLRQRRADVDGRLGAVREEWRDLDVRAAEISLRGESVTSTLARELHATPEEARGVACPELPEGVTVAAHAEQLAAKLEGLGPVNPLALDELAALEERHRELDSQVNDVRAARRELQEVVRKVDAEIMSSFAAAAADVNQHFSSLVETLFPGGTGRMSLTDPEDLLNTGVEVEVRPSGRNVRRVSLLSGGERSLAALAFLFAVFRSRPSPFYLMDEVEAALDDVNLHRFLDLVREFRDEAQLIIVSHQKRTMETGDALFGVTMAPGGSSQVVSQKVNGRVGVAPGAAAS